MRRRGRGRGCGVWVSTRADVTGSVLGNCRRRVVLVKSSSSAPFWELWELGLMLGKKEKRKAEALRQALLWD
jgi:hypothetical protein